LPRRLPPPELTNGPHLSYAIQWFSFAAIVLIGSFTLFRRTVRRGVSTRD
jgi:surfeit locus 1 family protein